MIGGMQFARRAVKPAIEEKVDLLHRSPKNIETAIGRLAEAILLRDIGMERKRTVELAETLGETMALADLLGRRRTLLEADAIAGGHRVPRHRLYAREFAVDRGARFATYVSPVVPHLTFKEALDDLIGREPRLARTADEVLSAYTKHHGFALLGLPAGMADEARMTVTRKIQNMLASYIERGAPMKTVREQLAAVGNFSKAYAENVYRTNLATAFTAGRMKMLADPDVAAAVPGMEFTSVRDSDVRPNHRAADGFIAGLDNKEWDRISPPLFFQCRCDLRSVSRLELRNRGLLLKNGSVRAWYPPNFAQSGPDRPGYGFGKRRVYGAG